MRNLTPRQFDVCRLVALGRMDKEIAAELNISENTVGMHLTAIYRKARVQSRVELTMWFLFLLPAAVKGLLDGLDKSST